MKKYATCYLLAILLITAIATYAQTTQMAAAMQKVSVGILDQFTPHSFLQHRAHDGSAGRVAYG